MTPDDLAPDERDEYEERAGIMEFDAGMSREDAEREALGRILRRRDTLRAMRDYAEATRVG